MKYERLMQIRERLESSGSCRQPWLGSTTDCRDDDIRDLLAYVDELKRANDNWLGRVNDALEALQR